MAKGCRDIKEFKYEDHVGLWANELKDFMPDMFFDTHEHISPESIIKDMSEERLRVALNTYNCMEWEDLLKIYSDLYSGKTLKYATCFGFVCREIDVRAANSYVLHKAKEDSRILPLLLAAPCDPGALKAGIEEAKELGVKVYGVKPYFEFAKRDGMFNARDVELEDFVPTEALEFCNDNHLVLILHTCGIGMGDPKLRDKIENWLNVYPNMKLILAHMGRFYKPAEFTEFVNSDFMERNRDKQFWFDISSVTDPGVYDEIVSHKDFLDRIMFAADHPYGLFLGVEMYSETMGGIFLTREDDYPWADKEMLAKFVEERKGLTYNNYHALKSLKDSIEKYIPENEREALKKEIFLSRACRVFEVAE